jgi:hypothetical protein
MPPPREAPVSQVVDRSEVKIERVKGPFRRAYLPAATNPIPFGVHGAVAEHYKVAPGAFEPHPTTLDYVVHRTAVLSRGLKRQKRRSQPLMV